MPEEKTDVQIREEKVRSALADLASKPGSPRNDKMIAALLRERSGLVAQQKADRVAQVDEQLKLYGYESGEGKSGGAKPEARKQPPQGRTTKPQQTGD